MVTGHRSPGLQIRVALWPHCPERLVQSWKVEDGAGMDQSGHKNKKKQQQKIKEIMQIRA